MNTKQTTKKGGNIPLRCENCIIRFIVWVYKFMVMLVRTFLTSVNPVITASRVLFICSVSGITFTFFSLVIAKTLNVYNIGSETYVDNPGRSSLNFAIQLGFGGLLFSGFLVFLLFLIGFMVFCRKCMILTCLETKKGLGSTSTRQNTKPKQNIVNSSTKDGDNRLKIY